MAPLAQFGKTRFWTFLRSAFFGFRCSTADGRWKTEDEGQERGKVQKGMSIVSVPWTVVRVPVFSGDEMIVEYGGNYAGSGRQATRLGLCGFQLGDGILRGIWSGMCMRDPLCLCVILGGGCWVVG